METKCREYRDLLDAYVDDELPPARAEAVAGHLAACAGCSRAYEALLASVAALRQGLGRQRAPDVLRARVRDAIRLAAAASDVPGNADKGAGLPGPGSDSTAATYDREVAGPAQVRPRRTRSWWWRGVAAAAALAGVAALSSTITLQVMGEPRTGSAAVQQEVLASHIRSLMPEHLTDVASNDQHNVKPWFNGRLPYSPPVVRLDDAGFALLGGRLDYVDGRTVAVIVYGRRKHIINVFAWPVPDPEAGVSLEQANGYHMLRWRSGGAELWAVSDLNVAELRDFVVRFRRAEQQGPAAAAAAR